MDVGQNRRNSNRRLGTKPFVAAEAIIGAQGELGVISFDTAFVACKPLLLQGPYSPPGLCSRSFYSGQSGSRFLVYPRTWSMPPLLTGPNTREEV